MPSGNELTPATPRQGVLDLDIEVERVVGGVEMGVLQNGIPYLTQTGLAGISGAARSTVFEISQEWEQSWGTNGEQRRRAAFFRDYLGRNGYNEPQLYMQIYKNGSPYYAYPDVVCMAFLEYFSFEAQVKNDTALTNYRNFARYGFQEFVYNALNYRPVDKWLHFNERVSILHNSVPFGYYSIFKETSGFIVDLINAGLAVNQHTVPDGSVGGVWGRFWTSSGFDSLYGNRVQYDHYYPASFPQSASNPQKAWAYPNNSWGEFQSWFRLTYLPTKYPIYILKKASILPGGQAEAVRLAGIYQAPQLPNG